MGKVPFHFRLPIAVEDHKGGYAALVAYLMQREKISLLVASSQSAAASGREEVRSGGIVFHYSKRASFNVS
jgi:hypothetical protein